MSDTQKHLEQVLCTSIFNEIARLEDLTVKVKAGDVTGWNWLIWGGITVVGFTLPMSLPGVSLLAVLGLGSPIIGSITNVLAANTVNQLNWVLMNEVEKQTLTLREALDNGTVEVMQQTWDTYLEWKKSFNFKPYKKKF